MKLQIPKDPLLFLEILVSGLSVVFLPLTFFPLFFDAFNLPKQLVLAIVSVVLFTLFLVRSVRDKKIAIAYTPITLVFGFFVLLHIVALFFKENNLLLGLTNSFGIFTILPLFLLHILVGNLAKKQVPSFFYKMFALVGTILGFLSILWYEGVNVTFPSALLKEKLFSPTGTLFITLCVLILCFVAVGTYLLASLRDLKKSRLAPLLTLSLLTMGVGGVILGYQLFTTAKPVFMPYGIGWSVALNALQASPLLGVGASNYEHAYVVSRPIGVNATQFWNIRFNAGPNFFYHYVTTFGLLGAATWLVLGYFLVLSLFHAPVVVALAGVVMGITAVLFSPNITLLFFLFFIMALFRYRQKELVIRLPENKSISIALFAVPLALLLLFVPVSVPEVLAELNLHSALATLDRGDLKGSFDLIHKAVSYVPYRSDYAMLASRVTFTVGSTILQQKDATDAQKQQAMQIIDQSINEAKAAIQAAPQNSIAWNNLAAIYQSLIPTSQQADTWALNTLDEALKRDPSNPLIRSDMAAVLDLQGNTDQAVQALELVVQMKPDLLQARYALASGYAKQKKFQAAQAQLETLLQALPPGSDDAKKVQQDIDAVKTVISQMNAQQNNQTQATPSAAPVSPTPTVSAAGKKLVPTPTLSPTPSIAQTSPSPPSIAP